MTALLLRLLVSSTRVPQAELEPWAEAMSAVCMGERECRLLAQIAIEESHFVRWVVDQSCNDEAWRASHQLHRVCDRGKAFGPWQIQDERMRGAGPEIQASVALEILRRRPTSWTTWARARARVDR